MKIKEIKKSGALHSKNYDEKSFKCLENFCHYKKKYILENGDR